MAGVLVGGNACPAAKLTPVCYWQKIWKGLNVMRQNWQFCDVVLTSNDNKYFMAHTAMLVASSSTFMNYFSGSDGAGRVESNSKINLYFPEVPSDVLQVVLDFIYGIIPATPVEVLKLCAGAKYFDIEEAYSYSIRYFANVDKSKKFEHPLGVNVSGLPSGNVAAAAVQVKDLELRHNAASPGVEKPPGASDGVPVPSGVRSRDAAELDCGDMTELSLADLALGNECPHMRRLIEQRKVKDAAHGLGFGAGADSRGSETGESGSSNEFDGYIDEGAVELSGFLNEETFVEQLNVVDDDSIDRHDGLASSCKDVPKFEDSNSSGRARSAGIEGSAVSDGTATPDKIFRLSSADVDVNFDDVIPAMMSGPCYAEVLNADDELPAEAFSDRKDSSVNNFESLAGFMFEEVAYQSDGSFAGACLEFKDARMSTMSSDSGSHHAGSEAEGTECQEKLQSKVKAHKFMCHDCSEDFATSYKLQTHQLKQHNKGKLFSCLHCSFKSPRKKDLQAHSLSQHGEKPPGVKIYSCTCCQYKCIDKNRFEEHEAIHQGILKFKCTLCSKAYTTRRGMKTHLKYHNENRPFKCSLCPSDFKVKSKLTDHMKLIHLQKGVKPYKCGYCDHFTAIRGNCNQHIKKNHPGQPVQVIDTMLFTRKNFKSYDYANLRGSDIDERHDIGSTQYAKQFPQF